ncbi:hypothetical protein NPIL_65041, partial [Nephila pilipes]
MQNSNLYFSNPGSSISKIMSQEPLQSSSFSNFGQLENEDISLQMGHSSKYLNYSGFESNQNALFDEEQSSVFPNHAESMSNETSTHFTQRESSVYNLAEILSEINEYSMEQSNSGIYYPETFSNESISKYVQQSSIPLNYPKSISNESFNHFKKQKKSENDTIPTSDVSFSYGREQSDSYLDYRGQMYNENNSSYMQQSISFLHEPVLKSSESIANDMQPLLNYVGAIPNESFTHFPQRKRLEYNPVEKISTSIYCETEQSNSYWNPPGSIYSENNSSSTQHSISSLPTPVSNSTECASYNMYAVTPGQSYNLGSYTKKNISSDIESSNSSFVNLDYNLRECNFRDMQDLSSSFNHHEVLSNDVISFENHHTHSASVHPGTALRVYKTNDMLNSYSSSNSPRPLTLKSSPCDNEQSKRSLFHPDFTSNETESSVEQYSQQISYTSSLNSGENISNIIQNTISVSENQYQETISRNMENSTSSFCIPGPFTNTNNSFNLQPSNSGVFQPDLILKEIHSRDMQPAGSPIYSTELHKNFNNFHETPISSTSYLCIGSTLYKNCTIDSSPMSLTNNYDNIPMNKDLDKSNEKDTVLHDYNKNNDIMPKAYISQGNKFKLTISNENGSRQCIFGDRNLCESKSNE